uniref:Teratocyte CUB-like domain n=1 Tax=Cotesia flavipes TaxID=89805 RepID=A0A8K1YTU5_COTFL|nr:teratocyte CUB-like domain [Cotesia flavipes]
MKTYLFLLFAVLITGSRAQPVNSEQTPTKSTLELVEDTEELIPILLYLLEDISDSHTWELKPYSNDSMDTWDYNIKVPKTWIIDAMKNAKVLEIEDDVSFVEPTNDELGVMKASRNVTHLPLKTSTVLE